MWQSLKQFVKAGIWVLIAGWIAALLYPLALEIRSAISTTVVSKLSPNTLFLALLGLLLVCLVLLALLFESKSKWRLLARYEFDEHLGLRRHKRTGRLVCPKCLQKDGAEAALHDLISGWRCEIDPHHYYTNPDHKASDRPPDPPVKAWS